MAAIYSHLLHDSFTQHAARPALMHGQGTSYADLTARAPRGRAGCNRWAFRKGTRRPVYREQAVLLFGHLSALFAGAVSLPLNPRFAREELRFFLKDSGARIAIVGPEPATSIEPLRQLRRPCMPSSPMSRCSMPPRAPSAPTPLTPMIRA